jgi:hypothetical protein
MFFLPKNNNSLENPYKNNNSLEKPQENPQENNKN